MSTVFVLFLISLAMCSIRFCSSGVVIGGLFSSCSSILVLSAICKFELCRCSFGTMLTLLLLNCWADFRWSSFRSLKSGRSFLHILEMSESNEPLLGLLIEISLTVSVLRFLLYSLPDESTLGFSLSLFMWFRVLQIGGVAFVFVDLYG